MAAYIVRRVIQMVFVVWIVTVLVFLLIKLIPGDPVLVMLGFNATPEKIAAVRAELWLDQPLIVQYGHWLGNVLHGDLGTSLAYRGSVSGMIAHRFPITIYLCGIALILSAVVGIGAGIICAVRRGGILDQAITVLCNTGVATPEFWLGILLIYGIALKLGWLPIQGWTSPFEDFWLSLQKSIMPVFCLAFVGISELTRQTRSAMLEVIHQDYIRTAWAKGLRERAVIMRHALKNALIPVVTILGLRLNFLFGGAVVVETVFNIPGLGRLIVSSVQVKDFLILQGCVLVIAVLVCLVNLIVDISYAYLDPRIQYR